MTVELIERIAKMEANAAAAKDFADERDRRYSEGAAAQDRAVAAALDTSKAAIAKAETATERRLEGLNELRAMAEDQARSYARQTEVHMWQGGMEKQMAALTEIVRSAADRGRGVKDMWGYLVGAGGIVALIIAFLKVV